MSKLVLKTGDEIVIADGSALGAFRVVTDTKADMVAAWDKLTDEALKEVQIKEDDDAQTVSATYEGLTCRDAISSTVQKDGTILTVFPIREMTEIEDLYAKLEAITEGQGVQDSAIDDLGTAVSELFETAAANA